MIVCLHCGAETSNGLALCDACRIAVVTYLDFVPIYYANLSRWSPKRIGGRPVPGSRIPVGVIPAAGDRIERTLDDAGATLARWARFLATKRPHYARLVDRLLRMDERTGITLLCKLFERRLSSIATLDEAGDFVREIRELEAHLRALTEHLVPGWYAGACRTCGTATFVVPGLTWVTCSVCGATTRADAHLDVILAEAGDWLAPPMRLAEAVVVLVDAEQSVDRLYARIKKWGQRGQLESVRLLGVSGDPVGPHRYRLGDVLRRLEHEGRLERMWRERVARVTGKSAA